MIALKKLIIESFSLIKTPIKKYNKNYIDVLKKYIEDCKSILDLGCGNNSILGRLKLKKKYTVGVDIDEESIRISKEKAIHDKYYLLNIKNIDKVFSPKTFDCVILIDVIEHLEKIEGIKLIKKIEDIAIKKIFIFTPNGFVYTGKQKKNPYLEHKSGWNVKIFKKMRYKVIGMNGIKYLRNNSSCIKYNPKNFWRIISSITNIFIRKIPQLAFHLLCLKQIKE